MALALTCLFALPSAAAGEEFLVDTLADTVDAVPGDEFCETATGDCTLRAAIEEGNVLEESSRIDFDEEVFEGESVDTIALSVGLPPITVRTFVNGGTCETEAGFTGPCVGIEGPAGETALSVSGAAQVTIARLALTGAQTGIELAEASRAKVQGSWFGIALDGSQSGNGTGLIVLPGSDRSLIGGEGASQGNVFAASTENGLEVHGGDEVRVLGNYFGVEPDGATVATNGGDDIEVAEFEEVAITSTSIGTRVSSIAAATPLCDGGCNVISGAAGDGIDLQGDGGSETPASSTSVLGNYIGVDAVGASTVPNGGAGVRVGESSHATIGGPANSEANRINGGSVGISAGPAAPDLAVRGNLIGFEAAGEDALGPPVDGIVVDSAELPSPAVEAEIADNRIRMEGGTAIAQRGQGAWIVGNEIHGSEWGIWTSEQTAGYGNVIDANLVEGAAVNGVLIENDFNEVAGNTILGAGAAGIRIDGASLAFGVSENTIGGDTAADENEIGSNGGAAVEILNLALTSNVVARNHGGGNAGQFIDLVALPEAEEGPNRGIEPPEFDTATQTEASGFAAPGATVRVFRKQTGFAGEIDSFLGSATADEAGEWMLVYDDAIPGGTAIAASQTSEGGTSELAFATVPGGESGGGGEGTGDATATETAAAGGEATPLTSARGVPRRRPGTRIRKRPRHKIHRRYARFAFTSSTPGSRFLCRIDRKPFDLCRSPRRYRHLRTGRHIFEVRALDPFGRVDPTPARFVFVVLR